MSEALPSSLGDFGIAVVTVEGESGLVTGNEGWTRWLGSRREQDPRYCTPSGDTLGRSRAQASKNYYTSTTVDSSPHVAHSKKIPATHCRSLKTKRRSLVPGGGVEPPRAEARRILSPLRLPVPPSRRRDCLNALLHSNSQRLANTTACELAQDKYRTTGVHMAGALSWFRMRKRNQHGEEPHTGSAVQGITWLCASTRRISLLCGALRAVN